MLLNLFLVLAVQLYQVNGLHLNHPLRRDKFDLAFYVYDGDWPCSQSDIEILETAIDDTHTLAQSAIDILSVEGAENSTSFRTWFGEENALPRRRTKILEKHYKSVKTNLVKPEMTVKFREDKAPHFPDASIKPTQNSLVYACPPLGHPVCARGTLAAVQSATEDMKAVYGTTLIIVCQAFFRTTATMESTMLKWQTDNTLNNLFPRPFALIHEVQHMMRATGDGERADDLAEPEPRVHGTRSCYSADCCYRLSDAKKIKNAQNYAIFALDVAAFPLLGAPASDDDCSSSNSKRQLTIDERSYWHRSERSVSGPGNILPRWEISNTSTNSFLTSTSTNTPISLASTATPQTTPGTNTPEVNNTPVNIPEGITTTPTTMITTTLTTATPAATYTVDNGAVIIVPVGAIVVGGPGGGSVSVGGVIIAVPANAQITANPDDVKETDAEQTETPTSTAACTMRTSTAVLYGSSDGVICQDLSGMNLAAIHKLFVANEVDSNTTTTTPVAQQTPIGTPIGTPVGTPVGTPSQNTTLAVVTSTPITSQGAGNLDSTPTTPTTTPSTTTSIIETATPSAGSYLAGITCSLSKDSQSMCKTSVLGTTGACLRSEDKTSGFLCVEDCPADSTCPGICAAAGYKGGYCANADNPCMCSNDDPTVSID